MAKNTTYYAWAEFVIGQSAQTGLATKTLRQGEKVTPEILGESQAAFNQHIKSGSIRAIPFPDDMPRNWWGSPIEWVREKARRLEAGIGTDYDTSEIEPELEPELDELGVS